MPTVQCFRSVSADRQTVWKFVESMDNWAPFIMGYQNHELIDTKRSKWTVKGDVGPLARTVDLEVGIDEWVEPDRVVFTLTGVTEAVEGGGGFYIGPGQMMIDGTQSAPLEQTVTKSNGRDSWFRRAFRAVFSGFEVQRLGPNLTEGLAADEPPDGDNTTPFAFVLILSAKGMMGPVVNALLDPLMHRAANELADKLVEAIHNQWSPKPP